MQSPQQYLFTPTLIFTWPKCRFTTDRMPSPKALEHAVTSKLLPKRTCGLASTEQSIEHWRPIWCAIVEELYTSDLITVVERHCLLEGSGEQPVDVGNQEARRRLKFFERSLADPGLLDSLGVLRAPTLTVLVPHYGETILVPYASLDGNVKPPSSPNVAEKPRAAQDPAKKRGSLATAQSLGMAPCRIEVRQCQPQKSPFPTLTNPTQERRRQDR